MNYRVYRLLLPYLVAIASTGIALLLTLGLEPLMTLTSSAFFFIAIILSTWYGGIRPGIVSVVLSALAIDYFLVTPVNQISLTNPDYWVLLVLFTLIALIINLLSSNLKESKRKVEQLSRKLQQESDQRLKTALNAAQMGMWDWDIVTGEITWSPEHEKLVGLAPGSFDGRYETFNACVYPEDREKLNQAIEQSLKHRTPYHHEFRVVWADGSIHWIEGRGKAFYNQQGQPVRMSGTIMAIDSRKQYVETLHTTSLQLQHQFEQQRLVLQMTQRIRNSLNLQDILQTTVDEVREYLKTDRVTIFQFSPSWGGTIIVESVADQWMPLLPLQIYDPCIGEQYVQPFLQGLVTAKSDIYNSGISPCHVEFLAQFQVRANLVVPIMKGDRLWGLLAAHHCQAPRQWQESEIDLLRQLAAQVSVALQQAALLEQLQRELTERQQAQEALQKSQHQIQQQLTEIETIYQSAPIGLNVLDTELRFVRINQRLAEMNGFSVEAHIGKTIRELLPDLADTSERLLLPILETGEPLLNVEIIGETPAQPGVKRIWLESFLPLRDGDRIIGINTVCEEITERKQAEQNLARAALRVQTLFHTSFDGIVTLDRQGNVIDANPRFSEMLGYTAEETANLNIRDWDAHFTKEELHQLLNDCINFNTGVLESRHRRKDGSIYDVEISYSLIEWQGEILRFCTCRDISERKQTQLALKQLNAELEQRVFERTAELTIVNDRLLEALLKQQQIQLLLSEKAQLLDLAHDTIISCDLNWLITFWNQGAQRMYGWTQAEALGKESHQLLQTQFPQPLAEIKAQLFEQGYWEGELIHLNRNHQSLTVASRWVMQKDEMGRPIKILEINNDITKRKRMEEALRQSEETFRLLSEFSPIGIFLCEVTGKFIYTNPRYQQIIGTSSEETLGEGWKEFVHPDDRQWVFQYWSDILATGSEGLFNDLRYQDSQGRVCYTQVRIAPIKATDGSVILFVGVVEDITERRKIDQMKKDFISVVSHELRTPLTSIRGSLGLVAGGVYDKKPDKMKNMIAIAARQSDRLVRLVNDILDLRRLESGQTNFNFQQLAAADLIQQSVDVMRSQAEQNKITLSVIPSVVAVLADGDAIVQTLTNLLSNAIKFSPQNSTITISAKVIPEDLATKKQLPSCALFSIQDQGRGIPEDRLESIFGQFQQIDASDAREKGGTGLGLAICLSIIEQHNGKIWVESVLNKGSTFYFTLPLNNPNV